ncbi:UNVERIFIED_CONTAM: hypothetical protein NCL1_51577 [Trichonephila clavipes]
MWMTLLFSKSNMPCFFGSILQSCTRNNISCQIKLRPLQFLCWTNSSISIIRPAMDSGRSRFRDILQSPFLKTTAKSLNFNLETSKNNCLGNYDFCIYVIFLVFDVKNIDLHTKFSFPL